jgi:predicted short-subunit dehydrogenase-like oxidoreductase (DUF2520 family)
VHPEIRPLSVAVVGAGRVGTALGVLLERAGHRVVAAWGRDASRDRVRRWLPWTRFVEPSVSPEAFGSVDLLLMCLPDDLLARGSNDLAAARAVPVGGVVAHVSGARQLDVLEAARAAGVAVMSLHPLQSFPDVETGLANLPGSGIAVTATDERTTLFGERVALDLGCVPFRVEDHAKPLYHAAAVFASNYLVTVQATAERLFRLAGVNDPAPLFEPLSRANLEAAFGTGPAEALTGPAVRGESGTIHRNAEAIRRADPDALSAYIELARLAAALAAASGRLIPEDRRQVDEELDRWR